MQVGMKKVPHIQEARSWLCPGWTRCCACQWSRGTSHQALSISGHSHVLLACHLSLQDTRHGNSKFKAVKCCTSNLPNLPGCSCWLNNNQLVVRCTPRHLAHPCFANPHSSTGNSSNHTCTTHIWAAFSILGLVQQLPVLLAAYFSKVKSIDGLTDEALFRPVKAGSH